MGARVQCAATKHCFVLRTASCERLCCIGQRRQQISTRAHSAHVVLIICCYSLLASVFGSLDSLKVYRSDSNRVSTYWCDCRVSGIHPPFAVATDRGHTSLESRV